MRTASKPAIKGNEDVHLHVRMVRRETDKAYQLLLSRGFWNHEVIMWVPKSVIGRLDLKAGDENKMVSVPAWLFNNFVAEKSYCH